MTEEVQKETTAEQPANAAPKAEKAPEKLKTDTDSLARGFNALAAQARDTLKVFRPTLAKLNAVVSKFHAIGNDQIGVELATYDKLREQNLYRGGMGDGNVNYALLSIYDARFLVRVMPDSKIDCYTENLNKPYGAIFNIDSDAFWYTTENSKTKAMFNSYDLSKEEDVAKLMGAISQINAVLAANDELREFDLPAAREKSIVPKAAPGGLKPHK
ncbi:MAG: hypothetical protein GC185_11470 [Alphaproteobacteria bacterium]|nr:hypothetical protein [Alphaproteobacteria bacterium]